MDVKGQNESHSILHFCNSKSKILGVGARNGYFIFYKAGNPLTQWYNAVISILKGPDVANPTISKLACAE